MRKMPLQSQGRIFAVVGTAALAATLLALLLGGVVSENIFEPALSDGGALVTTVAEYLPDASEDFRTRVTSFNGIGIWGKPTSKNVCWWKRHSDPICLCRSQVLYLKNLRLS
jgi:hypothetical protein